MISGCRGGEEDCEATSAVVGAGAPSSREEEEAQGAARVRARLLREAEQIEFAYCLIPNCVRSRVYIS